jgi:gluconolactonase
MQMRCAFTAALLIFAAVPCTGQAAAPDETSGIVRMIDGVRVEKLADGLTFPEGPLWHPDGYLIFSDIQGGLIGRIKPEGGWEPWITFTPPRQTNGLLLSRDHKTIYAAGHGELALLAIDAGTKAVRVLSPAPEAGAKYNDVNDVAEDAAGNVFFTDPSWSAKPNGPQGIYRYNVKDGSTTRVVELDHAPNGITISPDQQWLYVDRNTADEIWRYRLSAEGSLADGKLWVTLEPKSGPDGMTIDRTGNLYVAQAGDGHVRVISPEGKTLRKIKVFDRICTNCEFENAGPGGVGDGHILYVTGGGQGGKMTGAVYKLTFPQLYDEWNDADKAGWAE